MASDSGRRSTSGYIWLVVALLWPVALLNYLDRQMLAAMKTSVIADIPDIGGDANWGYMLGLFKWVYAVLSPLGGYVADRFSRRVTICASLFMWSAVTWATGYVTTYDGLLWTRALMGISEAFYIPAALALIADYHSAGTRSRAVGIHQMAIYSGLIIGGFAGYVADSESLGWRVAFDVTGLSGIIYAFPLLFLLKDAPSRPGDADSGMNGGTSSQSSKPSFPAAALELFGNPSYWLMILYFTLPAIAGWVVRDWMPDILKTKFDISQGKAGVSATLYVNIASILGATIGGWAADRLMKRTLRGRIFVSAVGMSLFIPALFGVGNSGTLFTAVAFLLLYGIGWGCFDSNNMPILSQVVRPQLRATGYGIMNFVSISAGGFADWNFGALKQADVPLNLIFGAFAAIALVSVFLVLMVRPRTDEELNRRNPST